MLCGALGLSLAACGADKENGESAGNTENTESAGSAQDGGKTFVPAGSKYDLAAADYTTLCDYSAVPITIVGDYEVDDGDVNGYFESWYNGSGPYYTKDETKTKISEGDIVDVDYVGKLDGEAFSGGSAEHQLIDVYANKSVTGGGYIEGFTEGLKGASVGDVIDCDVTFPEDYGNAELAGKAVVFSFAVNSIQREVPFDEVDDAVVEANFSGTMGVSTVEELRDKIRTMLVENAEYTREYDTYQKVQEYLLENCRVEIPEDYLEARVADYRYTFVDQYCGGDESQLADIVSEYYGITLEEMEQEWYSGMEDSVLIEFIMLTIAEEMGIMGDDDEFDTYAAQMVTRGGYESVEKLYYMYGYGDEEYGEKILRRYYMCDTALETVCDNAVVTVEAPEEAVDGTGAVDGTEAVENTEE